MDVWLFGNSGKPILEQSRAIAYPFLACPHDFCHGEPKVGNRCAFGMLDMLVGGDLSSSEAGHDGWQIRAFVKHATAQARAHGEHDVIKESTFPFLDCIHLGGQLSELLDVKEIELLEVAQNFLLVLVVGPPVVADRFVEYAVEGEGGIPSLRRDHQGGDPGEVGLQGEDH